HMHSIGFTLYSEMLADTVRMLKEGKKPDPDRPLATATEVNLRIPALLPETYLPDVHGRLLIYKRLASATSEDELRDLKVELIDRFGLLPDATRNLFSVTSLKLKALTLGIDRIEANATGGKLRFTPRTTIDPLYVVRLVQKQSGRFALAGTDQLRFRAESHDVAQRISLVDDILELLQQGVARA